MNWQHGLTRCTSVLPREAKQNYESVSGFITDPVNKVKFESALMIQMMIRRRLAKQKVRGMITGEKAKACIFVIQRAAKRWCARALKRKHARNDMLRRQVRMVIIIQRKFRQFGTAIAS